jgi:hypothetical protein
MKIKAQNAVFAILDLTMEIAAKQRVLTNLLVTSLSKDENEVDSTIGELNKQTEEELNLIRAKVLQYSEIDLNDLLNGDFDI